MKPELLIAALSGTVLLIVICATAYRRRRRKVKELRSLLEFAQKQIDELQDAIARSRESSDAIAQRATDQARRIAWLETRIHKPRANADEVLDDSILNETPKLSMTERRHRVITLANRGKNPESIATSLGLFKGEVELILSLNQAAAAARMPI